MSRLAASYRQELLILRQNLLPFTQTQLFLDQVAMFGMS